MRTIALVVLEEEVVDEITVIGSASGIERILRHSEHLFPESVELCELCACGHGILSVDERSEFLAYLLDLGSVRELEIVLVDEVVILLFQRHCKEDIGIAVDVLRRRVERGIEGDEVLIIADRAAFEAVFRDQISPFRVAYILGEEYTPVHSEKPWDDIVRRIGRELVRELIFRVLL